MVLPDGVKVTIEGTAEEVAAVLQRVSGSPPQESATGRATTRPRRRGRRTAKPRGTGSGAGRIKATGPVDHIRELVKSDYFKTKRSLSDVQQKLEERAHIYAVTSLSPVLFRLVGAKELRRIKEDGMWRYVNP